MKTAIVTDSNSGIRSQEAEQLGIFVIPMSVTIQEKEYFEGVDITTSELYELQEKGIETFTSQPKLGKLKEIWDDILKNYDELIYIPMSSSLSSSCANATVLSEEYEGKVVVADTQKISITLRQDVLDALTLSKRGKSAQEIKEYLELHKKEAIIYVIVPTLKYLKRGGRITPATATLANMIKIKPILRIFGGKLDACHKVRTISKGMNAMITLIEKDMETLVPDANHKDYHMYVAYSKDLDLAITFKNILNDYFEDMNVEFIDNLSISIGSHIGPGCVAVGIAKKLDD